MTAPTLTDFLLARIAEDEAAAQRAAGHPYDIVGTPWGDPYDIVADDRSSRADHWLAVAPARVLAECEAKRQIVERCTALLRVEVWEYDDAPDLVEAVLCDLALPYADHPDYREEWKP